MAAAAAAAAASAVIGLKRGRRVTGRVIYDRRSVHRASASAPPRRAVKCLVFAEGDCVASRTRPPPPPSPPPPPPTTDRSVDTPTVIVSQASELSSRVQTPAA